MERISGIDMVMFTLSFVTSKRRATLTKHNPPEIKTPPADKDRFTVAPPFQWK
jgi:hypothetical protein